MKKKKIGIVICLILFVYFIGGIVYSFCRKTEVFNKNNVDNNMQIKGFEYLCNDDELEIYKEEFKLLKNNLESGNIDYIEYAHSISKMFIIDLYSLSNKKNMYDVGGLEFVYPDARENYKLNVTNTLYKYMEDNSDGNREQELPQVGEVVITDNETIEYEINNIKYEGYKINVDIKYVKDLEYDSKSEIILIRSDKYLYIVEKN